MPPAFKSAPSSEPVLLCFSHLRWDFVYQRPQHLLTRAAAAYHVIFFEEPVFEPCSQVHVRLNPHKSGVIVATPVFPAEFAQAQVEDRLRSLVDQALVPHRSSKLVLWYYTPMALGFSDHLQADVCIYDCMDELSAFRGAPAEMCAREQDLFAKADLVFCGGASLYEAKRSQHHAVYAFPSSVDRTHFAKAKAGLHAEPADQIGISHPRVGFFGVIDERLDLALIADVAEARPDVQFILLGPVVKIDPDTLPRGPNIHHLGGKSYDELPTYLGGWDAGFMPFALNESTRFISPTKTPEFLSGGLRLASTPVADVVRPYGVEGLVEIANTATEMSRAIDICLTKANPELQAKIDKKLATMSWDRTWSAMNRIIESKLPQQPAGTNSRIYAGEAPSYV